MVNNSTNINKTNNYLLPQTIEQQKNTMICGIGNSDPGLVQAQKCCKVKPGNGTALC
jgi:hypothetical protein